MSGTDFVCGGVWQPDMLVGGQLRQYQMQGLKWLVSLYNNKLSGVLHRFTTCHGCFADPLASEACGRAPTFPLTTVC